MSIPITWAAFSARNAEKLPLAHPTSSTIKSLRIFGRTNRRVFPIYGWSNPCNTLTDSSSLKRRKVHSRSRNSLSLCLGDPIRKRFNKNKTRTNKGGFFSLGTTTPIRNLFRCLVRLIGLLRNDRRELELRPSPAKPKRRVLGPDVGMRSRGFRGSQLPRG